MSRTILPAVLCTLAVSILCGCTATTETASNDTTASNTATDGETAANTESPQLSSGVEESADETSTQVAGTPEIGDPAPGWNDLIGVDDQQHSLEDLSDAKAVAVVFTCNSCPVARAYEERLVQLAQDYEDKSVELVAINVNNVEGDKLPAMKERATEQDFSFPYLYDPSQQIAREYGATVTPHAFLLDGDRNVAYMGAIDDSQDPEKVEEHYLRDAIDAVLAGETPATTETQQFGCGIKYDS